jgi:hypothetical protein
MTWLSLGSDKENAPARTDAGTKGLRNRYVTGTTEQRVSFPGAAGDNPPSYYIAAALSIGDTTQELIPPEYTATAEEFTELFGAQWVAHYIANGVVDGTLYNLGNGANNVSQQVLYEILATSGRRMQLRGRHPGRLVYGNSIMNPEWPGYQVDPETLEVTPQPRLISTNEEGVLMPGAKCVFHPPSVLARKLVPYLTKVEAPTSAGSDIDDCTFWVELSHTVNHAKTPYDLKYPPGDGKYYCEFFFYFTAPEPHPNWQPQQETQWTKHVAQWSGAAFAGLSGIVPLLKTNGSASRVLWPGMPWPETLLSVRYWRTGLASQILDISTYPSEGKLVTADTGTGWSTTLDLSVLLAHADLESVEVTFWPEAVAADSFRVPWFGACSNSQVDHTGGYIHDAGTGRRCMNIDCTKFLAGTYRGQCWDPAATGFYFADVYNTGRARMAPTSVKDSTFFSRRWCDCSLVLNQQQAGESSYRNFSYERSGGPSWAELLGRFSNGPTPGGGYSRREPVHAPKYGRVSLVDHLEGGQVQSVTYGAWISAEEQDASSTSKIAGSIATAVSGWAARENELGAAQQNSLKQYHSGNGGNVHLYNLAHGNNGMAVRARLSDDVEELHLIGASASASEDTSVSVTVLGWLS